MCPAGVTSRRLLLNPERPIYLGKVALSITHVHSVRSWSIGEDKGVIFVSSYVNCKYVFKISRQQDGPKSTLFLMRPNLHRPYQLVLRKFARTKALPCSSRCNSRSIAPLGDCPSIRLPFRTNLGLKRKKSGRVLFPFSAPEC